MRADSRAVLVAVEGASDEPVARRLVEEAGLEVSTVHRTRGKNALDQNLRKYNEAARTFRWLVLRDLDKDADCAPTLAVRLLKKPAANMRFRIAVHAVEAWLLADRSRISAFLDIPLNRVPTSPETLEDPKQELVNLARRSRKREIVEDMVPEQGLSSKVGPAYVSRLIEFAGSHWRPGEAARRSESLSRARRALSTF